MTTRSPITSCGGAANSATTDIQTPSWTTTPSPISMCCGDSTRAGGTMTERPNRRNAPGVGGVRSLASPRAKARLRRPLTSPGMSPPRWRRSRGSIGRAGWRLFCVRSGTCFCARSTTCFCAQGTTCFCARSTTCHPRSVAAGDRPNVVLVVWDTCRADAVDATSAHGPTPALAQLAQRGCAHPLAVAPSNWTLPSHAALFTGRLPGSLGLTSLPDQTGQPGMGYAPVLEAHRDRLLPAVLSAHGYWTGGVSANPWVGPLNGSSPGFDDFVVVRGRPTPPSWEGSARQRAAAVVAGWQARDDDGAAEARSIVERWAGEITDQPFFWFVNLMECHSPYLPPRRWSDLSGPGRVRAARDAARWQTMRSFYRVSLGEERLPDDVIERTRRQYAASVRSLDGWLADLLELLDSTGRLDET